MSCFLSRIYIKPQLRVVIRSTIYVVSYLVSTSNHNQMPLVFQSALLFLISYLHQTTTLSVHFCCFLSRIYIKPQPWVLLEQSKKRCFLSRIYIKPQQRRDDQGRGLGCFLSRIYIKPQLLQLLSACALCCFLSRIYIKPQHLSSTCRPFYVVSYLVSTSNHNSSPINHDVNELFLISYLHQTTTSISRCSADWCCFLSRIYIKPQLARANNLSREGCFLSRIYIKPQRYRR